MRCGECRRRPGDGVWTAGQTSAERPGQTRKSCTERAPRAPTQPRSGVIRVTLDTSRPRGCTVFEHGSVLSNHGQQGGNVEEKFSLSQRTLAEVLGTALLVLVGPGSVVATLALAGKVTPAITGADLLGISFAFGLIIAAMVYALGKVSGCHINPAVTAGRALTKRFPAREVPAYWAAQVLGAVIGALGIWAVFAHTGIKLGMGQTSFNESTTAWGSAIFAEGIG